MVGLENKNNLPMFAKGHRIFPKQNRRLARKMNVTKQKKGLDKSDNASSSSIESICKSSRCLFHLHHHCGATFMDFFCVATKLLWTGVVVSVKRSPRNEE